MKLILIILTTLATLPSLACLADYTQEIVHNIDIFRFTYGEENKTIEIRGKRWETHTLKLVRLAEDAQVSIAGDIYEVIDGQVVIPINRRHQKVQVSSGDKNTQLIIEATFAPNPRCGIRP